MSPLVSPSVCVSHGRPARVWLWGSMAPTQPASHSSQEGPQSGRRGARRSGPGPGARPGPRTRSGRTPAVQASRSLGGTLQPGIARVGSETQGDQAGSSAGLPGHMPGPCQPPPMPPTPRAGCLPHAWQGVGLGRLGCDVGSQAPARAPQGTVSPRHGEAEGRWDASLSHTEECAGARRRERRPEKSRLGVSADGTGEPAAPSSGRGGLVRLGLPRKGFGAHGRAWSVGSLSLSPPARLAPAPAPRPPCTPPPAAGRAGVPGLGGTRSKYPHALGSAVTKARPGRPGQALGAGDTGGGRVRLAEGGRWGGGGSGRGTA